MRIGVMGAGAVGCFVGGQLAARGHDVVFVGRTRTQGEVAGGMVLTDLAGETVRVPKEKIVFYTEPSALADADVVLCCVKSAHSDEAGEALAGVLAKDAIVVSLQNGVRNADALRAKLATQTVLGGIVGFNVVPREGGAFRRATTGPLVVEASDDPRVATLAGALAAAGFEVLLERDIRGHQWTKLVMNLNNAVSALTGAPTRDLVFVDAYRRILAALMAEALDVMKRARVRPARIGAIPVQLFPAMLRLPSPVLKVVARAQLRIDPEARSSMHEDMVRRRATEVDFLNGEVVRLAASYGGDAPLSRRIVELVHGAEREARGCPNIAPDALWRALTEAR